MSTQAMTIEAVYEAGVLKLAQRLPLAEKQRVTVTIQVPSAVTDWPADVAAIYQELADEDRQLAADMWPSVKESWPRHGADQP